jgi:hypothetical protein
VPHSTSWPAASTSRSTLTRIHHADRRWELILAKLKSGEMPPADVERPEDEIKTLVSFLETEFARADESMRPDPGRVTARRLNRAEYTNTIRDLLAIEFRATRISPRTSANSTTSARSSPCRRS